MPAANDDSSTWSSVFSNPFSDKVLSLLPGRDKAKVSARQRSTRQNRIPDVHVRDGEQQPLLSDIQLPGSSASYSATSTANQQPRASTDPANLIRVPKKVASVINVEPKVWFANERTWLAYLSIAVLLGSLSGTLFAGSGSEAHNGREKVVKAFGSVYGVLALLVAVYGYALFQKRVTMIKRRSADAFDEIFFPVAIGVAIFSAILTNLVLRIIDFREHLASHDHRAGHGHHHNQTTSF